MFASETTQRSCTDNRLKAEHREKVENIPKPPIEEHVDRLLPKAFALSCKARCEASNNEQENKEIDTRPHTQTLTIWLCQIS